jgi:hypothetical protein
MTAFILVGVGLVMASPAIDRYLWPHTSLLFGAASIFVGIHGVLYAGIRRRMLDVLVAHQCPLCQWALSHSSSVSQVFWFGAHISRILGLLTWFGALLALDVTSLWTTVMSSLEDYSFSWCLWPLLIGSGTYMIGTMIYRHLDMQMEMLTFHNRPSDLHHNHRSPIIDWIANVLARSNS